MIVLSSHEFCRAAETIPMPNPSTVANTVAAKREYGGMRQAGAQFVHHHAVRLERATEVAMHRVPRNNPYCT